MEARQGGQGRHASESRRVSSAHSVLSSLCAQHSPDFIIYLPPSSNRHLCYFYILSFASHRKHAVVNYLYQEEKVLARVTRS